MTIREAMVMSTGESLPAGDHSDGVRRPGAIVFERPTRTQQNTKDQTDINRIVSRFASTNQLPQVVQPPTFRDFEGVFDFQTAQNALIKADRAFMAMPSKVRKRFNNNAALFVEFCSDPENLPEMRKLGLAVPEVKKEDPPVAKKED